MIFSVRRAPVAYTRKYAIATGDSTVGSDPIATGQNLTDLLSVMIRIDVDHPDKAKPYAIPKDNPFVSLAGARPETWAYGLRNPWRMAVDPKTGHLWVTQNGQDLFEQNYFVRKGDNFGWSERELLGRDWAEACLPERMREGAKGIAGSWPPVRAPTPCWVSEAAGSPTPNPSERTSTVPSGALPLPSRRPML